MVAYRVAEVAELLGVSDDTVRRWCEDGKLRAAHSGGRRTIDGIALAEFLAERGEGFRPSTLSAQSARNRLTGIVIRVERDGLMALVEICAPPHRLVSVMTREAADELGLTPGVLATAAIKATNVVVEIP